MKLKIHLQKDNLINLIKAVSILTLIMGCNNKIIMLVSFGIAICCILFFELNDVFAYVFLLLPFANIFKIGIDSSSLFTYIGLLLALRIVISIKKISRKFMVFYVIFLVIIVMGCKWNFTLLIKQATIPLLIYGFFNFTNCPTKKIICNWTIGTIVASIVAEFHKFIPGVSVFLKTIRVHEVTFEAYRFTGLYSDPNYYATTLVLIIVGLLIFIKNKEISKIWWMACGLLIIFGIDTVSKSFFLMLFVIIILYFAITLKRKEYIKIVLIVTIVLLVCLFEVEKDITFFDTIINRFQSGDIVTGRGKIWRAYLEEFTSNPFKLIVGHGIGSDVLNFYAPHNSYIEFIYHYGITGTIVYVLCLCSTIRRNKAAVFEDYIPSFCLILLAFFLGYAQAFDFPYLLIYVCSFWGVFKLQK